MSELENELDRWTATCPCGHTFKMLDLKSDMIRGYGGKWFNKSVERNAITTDRQEVQCPKCLLWFDNMEEAE